MAYSNGSGGRRVVLGSLVLLLGWTKNAFGLLFGGWEGWIETRGEVGICGELGYRSRDSERCSCGENESAQLG